MLLKPYKFKIIFLDGESWIVKLKRNKRTYYEFCNGCNHYINDMCTFPQFIKDCICLNEFREVSRSNKKYAYQGYVIEKI